MDISTGINGLAVFISTFSLYIHTKLSGWCCSRPLQNNTHRMKHFCIQMNAYQMEYLDKTMHICNAVMRGDNVVTIAKTNDKAKHSISIYCALYRYGLSSRKCLLNLGKCRVMPLK